MHPDDRDSGLRTAELVAAFSLATDLGLGQPTEHVLRSWQIAARLADEIGLDEDTRGSLFYVVMLAWVGCVADTPELAGWFGDDIAFRRDSYAVDRSALPMLGFMLSHVGAGRPARHRLRLAANLIVTGGRAVEHGLMSHCVTTGHMAERFGLDDGVRDSLQQVFTRWDGTGMPAGVGGERIALTVRLFHLADVVEVASRAGGVDGAVDVVRARSGTQFDPALVEVFCAAAADVLEATSEVPDWEVLVAEVPALQQRMSERELDAALEAVADFTDLRSRWRSGHSVGVADLAARAAGLAGLRPGEVRLLRRAALVHDIGMHGVPATILDKATPLTRAEAERLRLYAYYTQRILSRPPALGRIGAVASLATERLDGSGYHRGLSGGAIPVVGRILAAADAYHAMTEARPYRPAISTEQARDQLRVAVRDGQLDGDAVAAVLGAAGHRPSKRRGGPAGLTPREMEVLTLIARGRSTRQVADALGISPRTAGTHIERIYTKTGASTRSTATLFAMQHGLLDTLDPFVP